jgi:hypothetical protein
MLRCDQHPSSIKFFRLFNMHQKVQSIHVHIVLCVVYCVILLVIVTDVLDFSCIIYVRCGNNFLVELGSNDCVSTVKESNVA